MARIRKPTESDPIRPMRPPLTPEAEESQMISLAMDLVKKRLLDGSATSQETTHFLKLATTKSQLENRLLAAQAEMAIAKKEALKSQQRVEELYAEALKAMKSYSGQEASSDEDDEYY